MSLERLIATAAAHRRVRAADLLIQLQGMATIRFNDMDRWAMIQEQLLAEAKNESGQV